MWFWTFLPFCNKSVSVKDFNPYFSKLTVPKTRWNNYVVFYSELSFSLETSNESTRNSTTEINIRRVTKMEKVFKRNLVETVRIMRQLQFTSVVCSHKHTEHQ